MIIAELGCGKYSDCFVVRSSGGRVVAMKLSYYQERTIRAFARYVNRGDRDAANDAKDQDAISVSMAMSEVAKHMRAHRMSPHFIHVYCEADIRCLPLRLAPLLKRRLPLLTPRQLKYSHVCLMQLYACNLTRFLASHRATDATVRVLLFQVIFTLACLQRVFPGFRHNDLSTNNVLVKRLRKPQHRGAQYCVGELTFAVRCPYSAALADFDFTHVPGHDVLTNERVLSGKYGITDGPNPSYDTHLLLNTVRRCLKRYNAPCPETCMFLRGLGLSREDRIRSAQPHLVPMTLLRDAYFSPLLTASMDAACPTYRVPT